MSASANKSEYQEINEISLGNILYKLLQFWPVFTLLIAIAFSIAWIYLRYTLPVYKTTAVLLIKDDKGGTPNTDILDALDLFGSKKIVENEVEVLQSKTLMQEVVKNLHLYAPITLEGRVLEQSAYILSPVVIEVQDPDSLQIQKKVEFKYLKESSAVLIDEKSYPLDQWVNTPYGVMKFIFNKYYKFQGKNNEENEYHYYFSLINVKQVANKIIDQIKIVPSGKQSTVIDLTIENEIPQRGEDILNELLKVYDQAAIQDKNILAANTLKFVQDRLKYVVNELDSVERVLQNYKVQNKITDISSQGHIFLETVAANDQKLSDINVQLAVLDQVEQYVKDKNARGGIVPATLGITDPALTTILQKLSDLEMQYVQAKKIAPENNPVIIALVDGINKIKPGLLENIQSQRRNLIAARNDLNATNNQYNSLLTTMPKKERELLSISRQQVIKNNIYTFLLQKREETALSFASAVADSRVIDKAESTASPIRPKTKLIYMAALLIALALGAIYIFIKELFTRSVQSRSDIEENTNTPILGELVYDTTKSSIVIEEGKRSFIAEQFRQLRTSLAYMGVDEQHKKVLITSSITSEGKSFIGINLGISLSLMGKKVVLIELDLRKPKISSQLGVSRQTGISNYLIGKIEPSEIIRGTNFKNFFLIPSGPIPPNPSELISNGRLIELFKYLESQFDYLIIDSAPISPVTDGTILSPMCDVTLFVIRHEYTPKIFIKKLEQNKVKGTLKNPAIVFNGIKIRGIGKYGYEYGRNYGYGYGYSEDAVKNKKWWQRLF